MWISFLFLAFFLYGLRCVLVGYFSRKRAKKISSMLIASGTVVEQQSINIDDSVLEKTFKKNSKFFSLSEQLDKNIRMKLLIFILLFLPIILLDAFGIITLERDMILIIALVLLSLIIILPSRLKAATSKRRFKRIANDIPFVIDVMAVCIQSGMTVEAALRYIAERISVINRDVALILNRTMLRADVSGVNSALEQLASEIPGTEIKMLCSTLQQSTNFGASIYNILNDLSKEIRQIQLLEMEEKVASLSSRMTIPMILLILFPLLILVAVPGLINIGSSM